MKEIIVIIVCVALMTGVQFMLLYGHVLVNLVIGSVIGLGVFGLYSMYESRLYKSKEKKWLMLVTGFLSVLIAYVTLEGLL